MSSGSHIYQWFHDKRDELVWPGADLHRVCILHAHTHKYSRISKICTPSKSRFLVGVGYMWFWPVMYCIIKQRLTWQGTIQTMFECCSHSHVVKTKKINSLDKKLKEKTARKVWRHSRAGAKIMTSSYGMTSYSLGTSTRNWRCHGCSSKETSK